MFCTFKTVLGIGRQVADSTLLPFETAVKSGIDRNLKDEIAINVNRLIVEA
jgi:hypothetical protein